MLRKEIKPQEHTIIAEKRNTIHSSINVSGKWEIHFFIQNAGQKPYKGENFHPPDIWFAIKVERYLNNVTFQSQICGRKKAEALLLRMISKKSAEVTEGVFNCTSVL